MKSNFKAYNSQRFIPQILRKFQRGGRNNQINPNVKSWSLIKQQSMSKAIRLHSILNTTSENSDERPYMTGYSSFQAKIRHSQSQESDPVIHTGVYHQLPIQMRSLYAKKTSQMFSKMADKSTSQWRQTNASNMMMSDTFKTDQAKTLKSQSRNDQRSFRPYNE